MSHKHNWKFYDCNPMIPPHMFEKCKCGNTKITYEDKVVYSHTVHFYGHPSLYDVHLTRASSHEDKLMLKLVCKEQQIKEIEVG